MSHGLRLHSDGIMLRHVTWQPFLGTFLRFISWWMPLISSITVFQSMYTIPLPLIFNYVKFQMSREVKIIQRISPPGLREHRRLPPCSECSVCVENAEVFVELFGSKLQTSIALPRN